MAKFEPTQEQKDIINANTNEKNILVSAAAGSGKTKVLTDKIVKMIKDNPDINLSNILIMTFTVKATQEMKIRIKNKIDEEIKANQNDERLITASATIQNANVTTIDSFCKGIVEKYYTVLNSSESMYKNFDPGYRIADEKELSILYDDILDKMLEEKVYSDEKKYGEFLNAYFKKSIDLDMKEKLFFKTFDFLSTLPDPIKKLDDWEGNYDNSKDALIRCEDIKLIKSLKIIVDDIKNNKEEYLDNVNRVVGYYNKTIDYYSNKGNLPDKDGKILDDVNKYKNELNAFIGFVEKIDSVDRDKINVETINKNPSIKNFINNFTRAKTIAKSNLKLSSSKSNDEKTDYTNLTKNVDPMLDKLSPIIERNKIIDEIKFYYEKCEELNLKNYTKVFYELIKEYFLRVVNEKINRNIYSISDYAILTYEILKYCDDNVIKELKDTYKYIFVDEYQDTNIIQEEILSKIASDHNLFMVGDVKQSIYGFRHAEPRIFLDKIKDYQTNSENSKYRLYTMNKNFRSSEKIIEFTNTVFDNIMTENFAKIDYKKDGRMIYKDWEIKDGEIVKTKIKEDNIEINDKKVEIHVVCDKEMYDKLKHEYDKEEEQQLADEKNTITANIVEAEFLASKIERLVNEDKSIKYSDIVVLFRSFYNRADIFLDAFRRHNIPVYAQMRKGFFDRMEIRLMVDILNVIDNEQQDIPVANVLCSNLFGLTNNEMAFIKLAALSQDKGNSFISCVKLSNSCLKYANKDNYEELISIDLENNKKNKEEYYENKIQQINDEISKIKDNDSDQNKIGELKKQIEVLNFEKKSDFESFDKRKSDLIEKVKNYRAFITNYKEIVDLDKIRWKLSTFIDKFNDLRTCARYYSISELIEKIYDDLNVKSVMLSMNDGIMRNANLDELYDLANNYEKTSFIGLFNFLRYIEKIKELKDDQGLAHVFDENDNVVRIMSIHQSKGLEFNYVFVSGCGSFYNTRDSWSSNLIQTDVEYGIALDEFNLKDKYSMQSYLKKKIADDKKINNAREEMRMLYVAITRAVKKLFITAAVNGGNNGFSFKKAYETYIDRYSEHLVDFKKDDNNENANNVINIANVNNTDASNKANIDNSNETNTNNETDTTKEKTKLKDVSELNTYIDLILSSVTKDTECCTVYSNLITMNEQDDNFTTKLKLQDVLNEKIDEKIQTNNNLSVEEISEVNDLMSKLDESTLNENIESKYAFQDLSKILKPKFSVSEIKKEHYDLKRINRTKKYTSNSTSFNDEQDPNLQSIQEDKERKDSTNIGNIYHTFMQFYDFEKVDDSNIDFSNIKFDEEKDEKGNIIDRKGEMKDKINKFIESNFAIDMKKAYKKLYREYKFMQLVSQKEINKYLAEYGIDNLPGIEIKEGEKSCFDEKNIVIQGIIDAFYIDDDDEIVVVDWKTDGIKNGKVSKKALIDNYDVQLKIYANVLSDLTGYKVKARYIYSFTLNEAIKLEDNN